MLDRYVGHKGGLIDSTHPEDEVEQLDLEEKFLRLLNLSLKTTLKMEPPGDANTTTPKLQPSAPVYDNFETMNYNSSTSKRNKSTYTSPSGRRGATDPLGVLSDTRKEDGLEGCRRNRWRTFSSTQAKGLSNR